MHQSGRMVKMKARGMHVTRMLAGWKNQMEKREKREVD
jgi:hypothetical protein